MTVSSITEERRANIREKATPISVFGSNNLDQGQNWHLNTYCSIVAYI